MKKLHICFIFILLTGLLLQIADAHEDISIVDVDHKLIKERDAAGLHIRTFEINITLVNNGDTISGNLTVSMEDSEGFTLSKIISLAPAEVKTVSFEWSTTKDVQQIINITYKPTPKGATQTSYNSGETSIVIEGINTGNATNSKTPGFEIIILFAAIIILQFFRQRIM
ncbi:MAG TPA: hypothetical protein ENI49_05185 [Thermoplasmatales archaeon]|nr:hypothetical protein [Thermoplasmatales archaeon]